jgi:uncharacterized membrane protein YeaQ/YmgE (transglycosylase-associated protein family)
MNGLMSLIGAHHVSSTTMWFILAMAISAAIAAGWIADSIMEKISFGIPVNSVLVLLGALLTLLLWRYLNLPFYREYGFGFLIAVCFGSMGMLLLLAFLRRFA